MQHELVCSNLLSLRPLALELIMRLMNVSANRVFPARLALRKICPIRTLCDRRVLFSLCGPYSCCNAMRPESTDFVISFPEDLLPLWNRSNPAECYSFVSSRAVGSPQRSFYATWVAFSAITREIVVSDMLLDGKLVRCLLLDSLPFTSDLSLAASCESITWCFPCWPPARL